MIVLGPLLLRASAAAVSGGVEPSSVTSAANDVRRSRFWLLTVSPFGLPRTEVLPTRRRPPISSRAHLPGTDDGPPGSPPWRALLRRRPSRRPRVRRSLIAPPTLSSARRSCRLAQRASSRPHRQAPTDVILTLSFVAALPTPRRLTRADTTVTSARRAASTSFLDRAADLVERAPIVPSCAACAVPVAPPSADRRHTHAQLPKRSTWNRLRWLPASRSALHENGMPRQLSNDRSTQDPPPPADEAWVLLLTLSTLLTWRLRWLPASRSALHENDFGGSLPPKRSTWNRLRWLPAPRSALHENGMPRQLSNDRSTQDPPPPADEAWVLLLTLSTLLTWRLWWFPASRSALHENDFGGSLPPRQRSRERRTTRCRPALGRLRG